MMGKTREVQVRLGCRRDGLLAGRVWVVVGGSSVVVVVVSLLLLLVGGNITHFRFVNDRPRVVTAGLQSPQRDRIPSFW